MPQLATQSDSEVVRNHVRDVYVKPAVQQGERLVKVKVGVVHRSLGLTNRVPLVCAALRSKKFLEENGLKLVEQSGPPSGQSTTVTLTYEILNSPRLPAVAHKNLLALRGVAKDVFHKLGGGETFIRKERSDFTTNTEIPGER